MRARDHLSSDTVVLNGKRGPKAHVVTGSCLTALTKNEAANA